MTDTTAPEVDTRQFTPNQIAIACAKRLARYADFDENWLAIIVERGIELAEDGAFTITTEGGQTFHLTAVDLGSATSTEKLAEDTVKIGKFAVRATVDGGTPSVEIGGTKTWSEGLVYLSPADARATALAMLEMADVAEKAVADPALIDAAQQREERAVAEARPHDERPRYLSKADENTVAKDESESYTEHWGGDRG